MGSSNAADQGNKSTQAMILGVPREQTLFLAACQFVHDLYYREMTTSREIEILRLRAQGGGGSSAQSRGQ
jgi:hypothetical protein